MSDNVKDLPTITFSSGATNSPAIGGFSDCLGIGLFNSSNSTGTVTVQVEPTDTGTAFLDHQSGGADITMTASESATISPVTFRQLRLRGTTVNANHAVVVVGQFRV